MVDVSLVDDGDVHVRLALPASLAFLLQFSTMIEIVQGLDPEYSKNNHISVNLHTDDRDDQRYTGANRVCFASIEFGILKFCDLVALSNISSLSG